MGDADDVPDDAEELLQTVADDLEEDPERVQQVVKGSTGLDLRDIDADDAEDALAAWNDRDPDALADAASEYVDDPGEVAAFSATIFDQIGEGGDSGNSAQQDSAGSSAGGSSGGSPPSRAEIEQIAQNAAQQAAPDADEIVAKLKRELAGGGGGGGGQQGGGPPDAGGQNLLAQVVAQRFLGDGGGSALAEEVQNEAMRSFIADLKRPDPSEIMADRLLMEQYGDMASEMFDGDSDVDVDGTFQDYFETKYGGDDDEDE